MVKKWEATGKLDFSVPVVIPVGMLDQSLHFFWVQDRELLASFRSRIQA